MIAKYVDRLLKGGYKLPPGRNPEEMSLMSDDAELDRQLDQVLDLFRFALKQSIHVFGDHFTRFGVVGATCRVHLLSMVHKGTKGFADRVAQFLVRLESIGPQAFKKYIIEEGEGIVFDQEREVDMVIHLLQFKQKVDDLWANAFESNEELGHTALLDDVLLKRSFQFEIKIAPVKQPV
jgi:hypothetical protein